jgi:hypothetical protein
MFELIELYCGAKKVAEIDVTGWKIKEVVQLMRCQRLLGRTGKYHKM